MDEDPRDIAATVTELHDVTRVHELAERRLGAGDARFVADLGIALWRRYAGQAVSPWQYRSVFDSVLRLLTLTPGVVDQAARLVSVVQDRHTTRYAASLLASAHSPADLGVVFDAGRSEELRACVLQELVLRGAEVRHRWATSSHWRYHPLGWLPLSLTPIEGRPVLPDYHLHGSSQELPVIAAEAVRGHGPVPHWQETTTPDEAASLAAAVDNWAEESNGHIEARTFAFDDDLPAAAVGDALVRVGLQCAQGMTTGLKVCSASQAWRQLFSAASTGGAYNSGEFGAYGRLLAWRSVAALVGAPHDAPAGDVEAIANRCSWYSFALSTPWFDRVAWDIGLAVVTPDRRRLAVLAATDTD
ncbi:DUF6183 family protein [Micromonospora sp. DT48]|uniref:DUF6183 family protein n=1 Tax=unclassified Micromonospora TaxID=2617518 RepID=UPI001323E5E8|nr:DUF6183 family protein [Micromonospora sp. CP22]MTK02646.1 hypothetical protein [Micromonospora sp. CP22]